MPKATALEFYRKKQTVLSLSQERPQSLETIRAAIKQECLFTESKLRDIEEAFYGRNRTMVDFVKHYHPHLAHIIRKLDISEMFKKAQLDDIIYDFIRAGHSEHAQRINIDRDSLDELYKCYIKIKENVPDAFVTISSGIRNMLKCLKIYCQSFTSLEPKQYMNAATYYERLRTDLYSAIKTNVDDIDHLSDRFENEGLDMKMFGMQVTDLARRCECKNMPFILMFPQCCVNIRNAIKAIKQWLQADELYLDEIKQSVHELNAVVSHVTNQVREWQAASIQLHYRMKNTQKEVLTSEMEAEDINSREIEYQKEFDTIQREYTIVEKEINNLAENSTTEEKKYAKQLKKKFQKTKRDFEKTEVKLTWAKDKSSQRRHKQLVLGQLKIDMKKNRSIYIQKLYDLDRIMDATTKLKEIIKLKSSDDTLKKIFFGIPVRFRRSDTIHIKNESRDLLQNAINIASGYVGNGWKTLYTSLPFYPHRGQLDLEKDISDIRNSSPRLTIKEEAKIALQKWRRINSRANFKDFKISLKNIGRNDILRKIQAAIEMKRASVVNKHTKDRVKDGQSEMVEKFRPHRFHLPDIGQNQMMAQFAQMEEWNL